MASITCPNCSAVLKTAAPVPAGKKVKCPKCAGVFLVQAEEEAPPDPKPRPAPPADSFSTEDEAPKGKSSASKPNDDAADGDEPIIKGPGKPKKNNTMMIVVISLLVVFLCCCPGVCIGGFFTFGDTIQKAIETEVKKQKK